MQWPVSLLLCLTVSLPTNSWCRQWLCISFQGSGAPLVTPSRLSALSASTWHPEGQPRAVTGSEPPASVPDPGICSYPCAGESSGPGLPPGKAAFGVCGLRYLQPLCRSHPQSIRGAETSLVLTSRENRSKKLLGQDLPKWDHGEMSLKYSKWKSNGRSCVLALSLRTWPYVKCLSTFLVLGSS